MNADSLSPALSRHALLREKAFVAGNWIDGDDWITVDNPATGGIIGQVPALGRAATKRAIDAAAAAMPLWAARPAGERAAILQRMARMMEERADSLAALLTQEQGKPLAQARGEIFYAASFLQWFGEEAKRAYGDIIPGHARDARLLVLKQPVGVVGAITPWNFPSAMITRKLGPALAAGCGFVLKPSELTPFSALAIAAIAQEAGVPDGLFSVVTGRPADIGAELLDNPVVRKISFTGSTPVGRMLMARSAPTVKKLSLELGGNAPFIVFDDADVDAAVAGAMLAKFRNGGQACVSANRFYVQSGIYDTFVERLAAATAALKVGDGAEAGVDVGPLIDERAVAKVAAHVADAVAQGAQILCGGVSEAHGPRYYAPTVISGVRPGMLVLREETFGPLAPVVRFETEEEAVALANDSEFGLAAYFYTRDMARTWRVAERLESGMVGINAGVLSTEVAPFGGVKQSGLGREGSHYGLEEYQELKYLCLSLA